MKLITDSNDMLNLSRLWGIGKKVGFVPTMGSLHEGHLSLVARSNQQCDITVVSIFVNPAQFGPQEDLSSYPRDLNRDLTLLDRYEVDYVFFPTAEMIYPEGFKSWITVEGLSDILCGVSRPGHFRGVATVVAKLVNLVNPDFMFMGEKDFQQCIVLETMLHDLNCHARVVRCPIVREKDGLAMSSRNKYLSEEERHNALCLFRSIKLAKSLYMTGETHPDKFSEQMSELITKAGGKIDYIALVNKDTLQPVETVDNNTRVLLAVHIGKTRLIDNKNII
ncbi:MAG: pantoate--beta-alanine ligase [Candidatus Cloacimonadaceae bacterium]